MLNFKMEPRFSLGQIEDALLKIDLEMFGLADRSGCSRHDGLLAARERISITLQRGLMQQLSTPQTPFVPSDKG